MIEGTDSFNVVPSLFYIRSEPSIPLSREVLGHTVGGIMFYLRRACRQEYGVRMGLMPICIFLSIFHKKSSTLGGFL